MGSRKKPGDEGYRAEEPNPAVEANKKAWEKKKSGSRKKPGDEGYRAEEPNPAVEANKKASEEIKAPVSSRVIYSDSGEIEKKIVTSGDIVKVEDVKTQQVTYYKASQQIKTAGEVSIPEQGIKDYETQRSELPKEKKVYSSFWEYLEEHPETTASEKTLKRAGYELFDITKDKGKDSALKALMGESLIKKTPLKKTPKIGLGLTKIEEAQKRIKTDFKPDTKGQETISIPLTSKGIGKLETEGEKRLYNLMFPTAQRPDYTKDAPKSKLKKSFEKYKMEALRGQHGTGLSEFHGTSISYSTPQGIIKTPKGEAISLAIGLVAQAGIGAGVAYTSIKIAKVGKVFSKYKVPLITAYGGSKVYTTYRDRGDPRKVAIDLLKDVAFFGGASYVSKLVKPSLKVGKTKIKYQEKFPGDYEYRLKQDRIQQISKLDRYGNVYESLDISATPGQKNLMGEIAKFPGKEPITGFKTIWKGIPKLYGIKFKGEYIPKQHLIFENKFGKVEVTNLKVEGVRPIFKGNKIVGYKNIGDRQLTFLEAQDRILATDLRTGELVEIDPLRIKSTATETFFKSKGIWITSKNLDAFRTVGRRVTAFNKQVKITNPEIKKIDLQIRPDKTGIDITDKTGSVSKIIQKIDFPRTTTITQETKLTPKTITQRPTGQKTISQTITKPATKPGQIIMISSLDTKQKSKQTSQTKIKIVSKLGTSPTQDTAHKVKSISYTKIEPTLKFKEIAKSQELIKIKPDIKLSVKSIPTLKVEQTVKQMITPKVAVKLQTEITTFPVQKIPPITEKFNIVAPPRPPYIPPVPPVHNLDYDLPRNIRGRGFNVFTRKFGNVVKLSDKPLTKQEAINFGAYSVGHTARASFWLGKSGGQATGSFKGKGVLSDFYRKGEKFIEKRSRRIKSKGELKEITLKGLMAIKSKSIIRGLFK